jgi:hypothetical protein
VVFRSPELTHATTKEQIVTDPNYAAFTALDPFFDIVQQGLAGLVDGDHYFDTIADDAEFEFRYHFPGWPETVRGRDALMALYAGYGNNIVLHVFVRLRRDLPSLDYGTAGELAWQAIARCQKGVQAALSDTATD